MKYSDDPRVVPLMHGLEKVPVEYLRQVSHVKRVMERWFADPVFEQALNDNPAEALASLGVDVKVEEIIPLINNEAALKLRDAVIAKDWESYPVSTIRYRAYLEEKYAFRDQTKLLSSSSNPLIAQWRQRQMNRCASELGYFKADAIVHPPVSFEISKGCTVGCWFCGVDAPKFDHNWHYTPENALLWKDVLGVVKKQIGDCIQTGFLYWATDPLDNPDYEKFLHDFYDVTGRCPQTTTALGIKDIERTRKLLNFTRTMDAQIDRFSVLSLKTLGIIHDSFTPEELIRVECIPQNREAKGRSLKSSAGRAKKYSVKKADELNKGGFGDTIACVSGFLFNMPDREVKLVTPCQTNERWPLGYWVVAKARFKNIDELKEVLDDLVKNHMKSQLILEEKIRLRWDLKWETTASDIKLISNYLVLTFYHHKNPESLMSMLENGEYTMEEIAVTREEQDDVPMAETFYFLNELFLKGFLDEEPEPQFFEKMQMVHA